MISIIEESSECRDHLNSMYGYEFEIYNKFSVKNGKECPFARAALKRIFQLEFKRRGKQFLASLGSKSWGSKKDEADDAEFIG